MSDLTFGFSQAGTSQIRSKNVSVWKYNLIPQKCFNYIFMKHRCIGLAVFSYAKFKMRSIPSVKRSGFQWSKRWCVASGISWTICTLLQTDNHASAILLESFTCPSWCATNSVKALKVVHIYPSLSQGDHSTWKVMEFSKTISRPGKSWKTAKVMESHGESWKMMMMS